MILQKEICVKVRIGSGSKNGKNACKKLEFIMTNKVTNRSATKKVVQSWIGKTAYEIGMELPVSGKAAHRMAKDAADWLIGEGHALSGIEPTEYVKNLRWSHLDAAPRGERPEATRIQNTLAPSGCGEDFDDLISSWLD